MAEKQAGGLGIRIGLTLSQLQSDFLAAEQTVRQGMTALNRQQNLVRIKMDTDTVGLDSITDKAKILEIQERGLNQILTMQRDKLTLATKAYQEYAASKNANATIAKNLETAMERERLAVARFEAQLKALQNQRTDINLQIRTDSIRQAENQIHENIAQINARIESIRVKTEIDTSKLGMTASEFDRAKAHVQGLNRELELQKQKLAELQKAFATSASTKGLSNTKTINLNTDIQRQIQEINQLKAKIEELNKIQPPKTNSLLGGYLDIKSNVTGRLNELTSAFSQLQGATSSADSALTSTLGVIGSIPSPVGKAVAALASIPIVVKGIENSLLDMAKPAIAAGDTFYVMSRGMQLSIADMGKLSTIAKVTGIDINEVNNTLRRFSMQMSKADGDNNIAVQTLKRYGAEITDENGRLKNAVELASELGKALKNAEAEGNGAAFRDIVGGKFWSGDFITFLEDFADNAEAAAKVVKNGLANPALAHAVQGNINTMNTQVAQFNAAFSSALMPVVNEIVPRTTERFGELTKVIAANKENIKFLGDAMAIPVRMMNELTDGVISLSKAIDEAKDKGTFWGGVFESLGQYRDDLSALMNVAPTTALTAIFSPAIGATDLAIAANRKEIEEYKKEQEETANAAKAKNDELQARQANTRALNKQTAEQEQKLGEALSSSEERRIKNTQEAEDIIFGIRHGSYEKSLRDIQRWEDEQIKSMRELQSLGENILDRDDTFAEEEKAVYALSNAKRLKLEEEKEARLAEIRQNIAAADKTALENRLEAIEKERQAWLKAGMEEAESVELAQKKIAKAYEESNAKIQEHYQNAADIEYELTHTAYEKQIYDIERWKEAKIKAGEDASAIVAEAAAKEAQAFEREVDRIKGLTQSLEDEIFEMEHSRYESDIRRALQKAQKAYEEGVAPDIISRWLGRKKADFDTKARESRERGGDYVKSPTGLSTWNGLPMLQQSTSLMTNENLIRGRLISTLSEEAKASVARTQSIKDMLPAMPSIAEQLSSASLGDKTIIHGDEITQISIPDLQAEMKKMGLTTSSMPQLNDITQMQTPQTIQTFETVVTPLNNIAAIASNILTAIENRQPAQVNVSPSISNNLGGAYVFDNAMRKALVDDITSRIVDEITSAVRQATSQANFSYGA